MAIITISREMGSGGIPIAHNVAEELGYVLVDGEAIGAVADEYGLTLEAIEKADEKPPAFVNGADERAEIDLHQIELIILEYALKGNVVIYGRGGQDLLNGIDSVFRVRIIAPFEERVERWAEREWIDPEQARVLVRRSDQQRAGFIKYFFDRDWDDPINYDLVVNTSRISEEMATKLICDGVQESQLVDRRAANKKILQDLILRKRVEIALLKETSVGSMLMGSFTIGAKDGVVRLSGTVHSNEEKKAVMKVAGNVPGSTKVVDDGIKVQGYRNDPSDH